MPSARRGPRLPSVPATGLSCLLRSGRGALGRLVQSADSITPATAVRDMLPRIDELTFETRGRFLHRNGNVLPW